METTWKAVQVATLAGIVALLVMQGVQMRRLESLEGAAEGVLGVELDGPRTTGRGFFAASPLRERLTAVEEEAPLWAIDDKRTIREEIRELETMSDRRAIQRKVEEIDVMLTDLDERRLAR